MCVGGQEEEPHNCKKIVRFTYSVLKCWSLIKMTSFVVSTNKAMPYFTLSTLVKKCCMKFFPLLSDDDPKASMWRGEAGY